MDLPFQTLNEQIANLTSLTGWLGQTAPQIRTPIEVATGERIAFGTSYPYSSEFQPVDLSLGNLPASLYAIATGQTERTAEGGLVAPETVTGPIGSAFPAFRNVQTYGAAIVMATGQSPESRLGRIVGADEKYYERGLPNLAAQLSGINYYRLTPEDVSRENRRRIAEVNQLERELQQLGYLP